jgi:hypothetical protein
MLLLVQLHVHTALRAQSLTDIHICELAIAGSRWDSLPPAYGISVMTSFAASLPFGLAPLAYAGNCSRW